MGNLESKFGVDAVPDTGLVELAYSHEDKVGRITLNRSRYANALSADLVEALIDAVQACVDKKVELLVLRGHGAIFCGGFDLRGLDQETDASLAYRFLRLETLLQSIHYAPCQTLVYAQGAVSGAGADLMAACRKRLVAPDASFRFPGIRFGILLGTNRLLALIGEKAYGVLLEQQKINSGLAVQLGLAQGLAQDADVGSLIEAEYSSLKRIPESTRRQLFAANTQQAAVDMGILAKTVTEPGLKARMQAYWEEAKAAAKGAPTPRR